MQCEDLEHVIEQEGLAPLPEEARAHVATCSHCQDFVADFQTILSIAGELPAEVEPPAHIWVSLQNQLELEGIIKTPAVSVPAAAGSSWWRDFFRSRALATATVGLIIAVAGILQIQQPPDPNAVSVRPVTALDPNWRVPFAKTAQVLNEQEIDLRNMQLASTSPVDSSFRQNLQQVDEFIADCERRVNADPQDEVALEYLSNAYQQKAELLAAMMDREGSIH
jgi:hypothetical protein